MSRKTVLHLLPLAGLVHGNAKAPGHNDFHPIIRAKLRAHAPAAFRIIESVWGKTP